MGVHGLWKLIEPAGKPVPVETLENKVLAVDVSIWLHQLMKGYQNPSGSSVSNAYLLGLFSRVCKLLFTNVKPVFVFDGGVPQLKKKTIAARQQQKSKSAQASEKLREQLLKNLLKQKAVSQVLEEIRGQTSPKKKAPDMFELPPLPEHEDSVSDVEEMSNSSSEEDVKPIKMKYRDLHTIDVNSAEFKALPADMRHDILTELKETRKQNSWGRIHEMPEESGDFSKYQMSRLLKRRSVQVSLEEAEKEMGGRTLSLVDVEALLAEGGIEINPQLGKRIASDDVTRFIYVREGDKQFQSSQNEDINQKESREETIIKEENTTKSEGREVSVLKIKEEIISSDELSDTELIKEVEAIETVHSKIKEENEEFGTEDMFENESSSEETFVNDVNIMKENSGLSQEQILAIIKDQNRDRMTVRDENYESIPSTSKGGFDLSVDETLGGKVINDLANENKGNSTSIKMKDSTTFSDSEPKILDSLYFKMMERMHGFTNKIETQSSVKVKKTSNLSTGVAHNRGMAKNSKGSGNPLDFSALASNSSDSEREPDHNLPCTVSTIVSSNTNSVSLFKKKSNNEQHKNEEIKHSMDNGTAKVPELSSSESDNDFVEVSPSKEPDLCLSESKKNTTGLHIEIQPTKGPIEDDIFADIFSEEKKDKTISSKERNSIGDLVSIEKYASVSNETLGDEERIFSKENNESIQDPEVSDYAYEADSSPSTQEEKSSTEHNRESLSSFETTEIYNTGSKKTDDKNVNLSDDKPTPTTVTDTDFHQESEDSEDADNPTPVEETGNTADSHEDKPKRKLNTKQLEKLQDILEDKEREILLDQNREDRLATSITDQMYQEAQELLRLFGVPYLVAPMEAEAQCAFLDLAGLTQGTITDDSDIWLFGGRRVYKNFFDQKKFVLEFQADYIHHYFKLNRNHLVLLALLVGSDYTEGLQGVGPVTALEILSTFPPPSADCRDTRELLDSLVRFKQWWQSPSFSPSNSQLAKKLRNIDLHQGFPSQAVVSAYLNPVVDESRETFSWGSPDLQALRDYAERKFGWSRNRTDQILLPVINKLSNKTSQLTLHTFFGAIPNISAHREQMSRRVQSAVNRLDGGRDDFEPVQTRPRQPRGGGRGRGRGRGRGTASAGGESAGGEVTGGRGRGRNPLDENLELFIHESVGKAPEVIPQREKDRMEALKRKQQAVEIFKNKKKKGMKKRKNIRQIKPEAGLSESSSEEN